YSFWLETCGDDLTPRPALDGTIDVDVAILGAGYTGLWTAYYLLEREPSLSVAILEKEIAGFGASGRNGGGLGSRFPLGLRRMGQLFGRQGAIEMQRALNTVVDEISGVAEREGFDMDFVRGGYIRLARSPYQVEVLEREQRALEEFGFGEDSEVLDAEQVAERVTVAGALAGHFNRNSAKIHPAKLARGLARAVERRGATIYEQTEVTGYTTGAYPALHTARGHARAKTIVLAGESYLSRFPQLRRRVMPVYSLITLTEPLSPADWQAIGWEAREGLSSATHMVKYLTHTADGRILFGGRGAPYHFGSRIKDEYDRHAPTLRMLQDDVRAWFPMLKDVRFTHSWGGPLGWPRDYVPTVSYDPAEGLAAAFGYTGTGVGPSNLFGRVLADLITRADSELTRLPLVNRRGRKWEPEPLRFLGVRYVQRGFERLDRKAEATGIAPNGKSLVERLTRH
ncbi:MAG TPA: FAD-dependent oxidoreductase, partial [Thermomicrobiales bacterium]|nr:FAD-dependent oxidoreductase [Thermomicrobiales bacterium]